MSPGKIRDQLSSLLQETTSVEGVLDTLVSKGVTQLVEVRHEVTEAWEALERAIEKLDEGYRDLL